MGIFKDNWGRYRELGFIPYPSSKKGKNPLVEWKGGAIPTNDLYSEWEKKHPDANLWVYLGNSFAVIDPDGPGAEEYVKSLNLPNCPTSISGKKSTHRWFKVSSPIKPLKVSNGEDQTFLELRTGSQGMLVPPSVHPETGKAYEWLKGHSPWDIPFPEFPGEAYERVKALLNKPAPKMEPATDGPEGSLDVKKYLDHHGIKYQIKLDGQRTIYALERCFFADQHTTPSIQGDSSIIQGADGKLGYYCFHNHCSFRTWKDAREAISGNASISEFCHGYKAPGDNKKQDRTIISLKKAVLDADQIRMMDFPEKRKILSPWLSEQTLVLTPGWRGVGKTWFALGLCDSVTRKTNFGPWETITPVPTLYIDGEMAIQDIRERVDILAISATEKRKEPLLIYSDFYGNSLGFPKANLLNYKWRTAIKEISLDWSVKLLVLDNLSSLCPGIDENSKFEWDPINQWLLDLRFNGLSVIMLHHTNKEGGQRGTSGREDNIDISISLIQPGDYVPEDGCRFILKFSKARIRTADLQLIQDTEFQLKEVDGKLEWNFSGTKRKNRIEVLRLLGEGIPQKEISEVIGISKGQVSKIRARLIEEDYITESGEITIKGTNLLRGN